MQPSRISDIARMHANVVCVCNIQVISTSVEQLETHQTSAPIVLASRVMPFGTVNISILILADKFAKERLVNRRVLFPLAHSIVVTAVLEVFVIAPNGAIPMIDISRTLVAGLQA